jgi:hypothetical protein
VAPEKVVLEDDLVADEIVLEDEPVADEVVLEDEPAAARAAFDDVPRIADDFRLDDIVNPYVGYQVPVVDQFVNPYRDTGYRAQTPSQSYAELCRRYCQDPPRSSVDSPDRKLAPAPSSSTSRDRLLEERRSNADLRLMGGLVLAGTALGAIALVAGDPSFENEAGFIGTGLLVGGGLVVGLALVTTGDKVELRFARNTVARLR